MSHKTVPDSFWGKVDRGRPDQCWEWQAGTNGRGYGRIRVAGRSESAHRYAYAISKGPIPTGMYVCHECDNTLCCNPAHLWLGSQTDNMADMRKKGRSPTNVGRSNPNSSLTPDDVRLIRAAYPEQTQTFLAQVFGVKQAHISSIVTRKTWRHI